MIVLSDEFYSGISAHPNPTDMEAVKLLVPAPAVLDLFMWLTYRCFTAKGPESIPIFGEFGLVSQLGVGEILSPALLQRRIGEVVVDDPGDLAGVSGSAVARRLPPASCTGVRRAQQADSIARVSVPHVESSPAASLAALPTKRLLTCID